MALQAAQSRVRALGVGFAVRVRSDANVGLTPHVSWFEYEMRWAYSCDGLSSSRAG